MHRGPHASSRIGTEFASAHAAPTGTGVRAQSTGSGTETEGAR